MHQGWPAKEHQRTFVVKHKKAKARIESATQSAACNIDVDTAPLANDCGIANNQISKFVSASNEKVISNNYIDDGM